MSDTRRGTPPNATIHIDRLRIRLKNVDETSVRAAMTGLGPQLARYLNDRDLQEGDPAASNAAQVKLAPVSHDSRDPASLRAVAVQAIAGAILTSQKSQGGRS
jgi:hypothetical protein